MLLLIPTAGEAARLLDGPCPEGEDPIATHVGDLEVHAALCGFGPVAAAALSAIAVARHRPDRCFLAGVAGTYDATRLPIGGVLRATEVRMADVGRGHGATQVSPSGLGFPQAPRAGDREAVGETLLLGPGPVAAHAIPGPLLTVAAASASPEDAEDRRTTSPGVLAEDMEGFAVALACRRLRTPLTILRGISNEAGESERVRWDLE
ncbi:MAG: phosphorylase family protein, partial [Planctomycetota bacterium]